MKYLIWSWEHDAWWGPHHRGYTREVKEAGRYSATEAGQIVSSSVMMEEMMVPEVHAESLGSPGFHPYTGGVTYD